VPERSTSDRIRRYLDLAEEARTAADSLRDLNARETMLAVAGCYEALAKQLESWDTEPCPDAVISPPISPKP
jgi:hypothetical protein